MQASIVTGASRGLGLALCAELLQRGFVVVGLARQHSEAFRLLARQYPQQLHYLRADMADSPALHGLLAEALQLLPMQAVRQLLLINNAGVVMPIASAGFYPTAELTQAIAINLTAPMLLTDALLRLSDELDCQLRIMCISSGAAVKAYPGWGVYGSSKAGLDHFCRHVAEEQQACANPALIAAVYPGVVDTDMQAHIRDSDPAQFPNKERFDALKREGGLSTPQQAARQLAEHLLSADFGHQPVLDIRHLPDQAQN